MKGHKFIALGCAFLPAWALACSFAGLQHDVQFAPASTRLDSRQVISLTNWFVEQRNPSRATGGVYRADIYAPAIKGDPASFKKAKLRLADTAGLLKTLDITTSVEVREHIDESASKATSHPDRLDILHATVQPACAKTGSCCKWSEGQAVERERQ